MPSQECYSHEILSMCPAESGLSILKWWEADEDREYWEGKVIPLTLWLLVRHSWRRVEGPDDDGYYESVEAWSYAEGLYTGENWSHDLTCGIEEFPEYNLEFGSTADMLAKFEEKLGRPFTGATG